MVQRILPFYGHLRHRQGAGDWLVCSPAAARGFGHLAGRDQQDGAACGLQEAHTLKDPHRLKTANVDRHPHFRLSFRAFHGLLFRENRLGDR